MSRDEKQVRDLIARWHRATAIGDVPTILNLIAPDAVFLVAGRPPILGRAAFESGLRQLLRTHRIDSTGNVHEVMVSGDLAVAWTTLKVNIRSLSGDDAVARAGHAMSVFKRQEDGSWALVRDANLLPAS